MSTGKVRQIREDKKAADGRAKKTNDGRWQGAASTTRLGQTKKEMAQQREGMMGGEREQLPPLDQVKLSSQPYCSLHSTAVTCLTGRSLATKPPFFMSTGPWEGLELGSGEER
jgi:hypothetical protein